MHACNMGMYVHKSQQQHPSDLIKGLKGHLMIIQWLLPVTCACAGEL